MSSILQKFMNTSIFITVWCVLYVQSDKDFDPSDMGGIEDQFKMPDAKDWPGLGDMPKFDDMLNIDKLPKIPKMPKMPDIPKMPDFGNMSDLGNMPDMGDIDNMPDLSKLSGMGGMEGLGDLGDLGNLDNIGDLGDLSKYADMAKGQGGDFGAGMDDFNFDMASIMGNKPKKQPIKEGPSIPLADNEATDEMTSEEKEKLEAGSETHEFQAEVTRLMDIIINSLYTGKEIFLRELISNSADALERARFMYLQDKDTKETKLEIKIEFDKDDNTISITDTGIGMTKQELIDNLGTVAKSGTTNFLEALSKSGDMNLIGQFGVGFYSAFLVADRVTVTSKSDDDDQHVWSSAADGKYSVSLDPRGNTLNKGSRVTLHMKKDAGDLLNENKLKDLSQRYSEFIQFPIYVKTFKTVTEEVPDDDNDDVKVEDGDDKKTKKVEKKVAQWEQVNIQKPLWLRPREEIKVQEYHEFYKTLLRDSDEPLTYVHFVAEGEIEFKCLLFIPKKAPSDLFENYFQKNSLIKLYVRRVLVAENFEGMLPKYFSFVSGIVDSDDLPLNVSREQLQEQQVIKVIRKKLERKVLEMIKKLSSDYDKRFEYYEKLKVSKKRSEEATEENDKKQIKLEIESAQFEYDQSLRWEKFHKEFGRTLKLGCYEDDQNRLKIAKILRLSTTKSNNKEISLDEYISNMKPQQKNKIYYASGEDIEQIKKSPSIQMLLKKDIEVLLLTDPMDESCIQRLGEYESKKFASAQKGTIDIDDDEDEKKRFDLFKEYYAPLIKQSKEVLGQRVSNIQISKRLVDVPCTVVTSEWGYSPYMEKMMKVQTVANQDQLKMMMGSKILEINPKHKTIYKLRNVIVEDNDNYKPWITDMINSLFDAATFSSGYDVPDGAKLSEYIFHQINAQAQRDPETFTKDKKADNVLVDESVLEDDLEKIREEIEAKEQEKKNKSIEDNQNDTTDNIDDIDEEPDMDDVSDDDGQTGRDEL